MRTSALVVIAFAVLGLTACAGGGQTAVPPPRDVTGSALDTASVRSTQTLYVATPSHIYVYTLGASTPRLTISGGLANVTQIAIGADGQRYASNFGTSNSFADSSVTQYARGKTTPTLTRTAGAFSASGVAVDPTGTVFASSFFRNTVSEYNPGSATPSRQAQTGVNGPGLLALHERKLYVGEAGSAQILRYAKGATTPDLTLTLVAPGTLPLGALTRGGPFIVARDGTVYAGGEVTANDLGFEEFVDIFGPNQSSPRASIVVTTGANAQNAPFVAIESDVLAVTDGIAALREYDVRGKPALVQTIAGLNKPGPVAIDAAERIYVGNAGGSVAVFADDAATRVQTITLPDFGTPVGITLGP